MTRQARLWIITRKHPPAVGGMEELSFQTARQLARRRPVRLIAWGRSQRWLPLFTACAAVRLLGGLLRRRVSILLLGDPVLSALGWLPGAFGVPVVCVVHGLDLTWSSSVYQSYLRTFFWRRIDGFICISRHTADLVRARGVPDDRIFIVPVGVAAPRDIVAAQVNGDPVLLFVGRLVVRKGAAWFVRDVLPDLQRAFPQLRLVLVGEGPERPAIEAAARESGTAGCVTLAGGVDDKTKWSLYARCDAVVVPNIPIDGDVEGFGIVAIEAGAAGKPVFAADLEGLRDAVTEGVSGWRLPPKDAGAWRAALLSRLRDRRQLEAQGGVAREHVSQTFDWESIGERYAAVIDRCESRH